MIIDGATHWSSGGPRPAAEDFDIETRSKAIYEWVRQVRGGVLAGAFTVERHISVAIIYFILGDRTAIPGVHAAFDEGLLGPLTFERRISVLMLIAPHVLSSEEIASLKADLNELRLLRNTMAHKPFWFHPEIDDKGDVVNLVPMIQRGKTPIALTTTFVEQLNTLIMRLIERTAILAATIEKHSSQSTLSQRLF